MPGHPTQGLYVRHVDQAPLQLHDPCVLEPGEGLSHRLPVGADHGGQVLMGVVGGYLHVVLTDYHPLALDEREDEARQPGGHTLEGNVFQTDLVAPEPLAQQMRYPEAYLGLLQYQAL
jgi:hypothetical protein